MQQLHNIIFIACFVWIGKTGLESLIALDLMHASFRKDLLKCIINHVALNAMGRYLSIYLSVT